MLKWREVWPELRFPGDEPPRGEIFLSWTSVDKSGQSVDSPQGVRLRESRAFGKSRPRRRNVPRSGTGESSLPRVGIIRPFSFFCGKFEFAFADANCAQFTPERVDDLLAQSNANHGGNPFPSVGIPGNRERARRSALEIPASAFRTLCANSHAGTPPANAHSFEIRTAIVTRE